MSCVTLPACLLMGKDNHSPSPKQSHTTACRGCSKNHPALDAAEGRPCSALDTTGVQATQKQPLQIH